MNPTFEKMVTDGEPWIFQDLCFSRFDFITVEEFVYTIPGRKVLNVRCFSWGDYT